MKKILRKFAFWILDRVKISQEKDDLQVFKEQECVAKGHIWKTYGIKNAENDNLKTNERCFCARCGQRYHQHVYKQNN